MKRLFVARTRSTAPDSGHEVSTQTGFVMQNALLVITIENEEDSLVALCSVFYASV